MSHLIDKIKEMVERQQRGPSNEVDYWKKRARNALLHYRSVSADVTCGNALLQHISPAAAEQARLYDEAMEKLSQLDPSCPPFIPLSRST